MKDFLEIKKISILKFFIDYLDLYEEYSTIKKDDINLLLSTDSKYNIKDEVFSMVLMLTYNINIKGKSLDILKSDVKFDFKVPKNSGMLIPIASDKSENKNYNVSDSFFSIILSVCISTLRGIILEKCRGTFLEDIYLPVVDINKLRENNRVEKNNLQF